MMGIAKANEHLLPPIRSRHDVARIFKESDDPLALTKTEIRQEKTQSTKDLRKEVLEISADP